MDVSVNKAFKVSMGNKYHAWRISGENKKTKSGNLQNPTKQDFIYWISESWDEVTAECVQAGFEEGCWKFLVEEEILVEKENIQ